MILKTMSGPIIDVLGNHFGLCKTCVSPYIFVSIAVVGLSTSMYTGYDGYFYTALIADTFWLTVK